MKQYIIKYDIYDAQHGLFKFAVHPKFTSHIIHYSVEEREDFIKSWASKLEKDMIYDNVETYFIDFDKVTIERITDKQQQLKEAI